MRSTGMLCMVYDQLQQPTKVESCDRHLVALVEKNYGPNPILASVLTSEAKALRALGRESDAIVIEKRLQSLSHPVAGVN
jgi:hypothetical protein